MHFLHALGINQYAIVQFALFVFMFTYLTTSVFGPYFKALLEREKRTLGGEQLAEEFHVKTAELNTEYQNKARSVRAQIQDIFAKKRNDATAEFDQVVAKARERANDLVERNRVEISRSIASANKDLESQTSTMALAITNKLLGK